MKKHYYLLPSLLLLRVLDSMPNPTISFFFHDQPDAMKITERLKKPGKIAKHTIHGITQHSSISGICATYSGYIAVSNYNGEIQFPRRHRESMLNLLVTTEMEPITLFDNTVDHWELKPGNPAQLYSLTQIYDQKNEHEAWNIQRESIATHNKIPLTALVIIAKPTNITLPLGIHPTTKTANMVLPPLYVKKGTNFVSNAAYAINIRHLFRPVESKTTTSPLRLTSQLLE